jgi:hypothetical protein
VFYDVGIESLNITGIGYKILPVWGSEMKTDELLFSRNVGR